MTQESFLTKNLRSEIYIFGYICDKISTNKQCGGYNEKVFINRCWWNINEVCSVK